MPDKVTPDENLVRIVQLFVPELQIKEITPIITGHINQTYHIRYVQEEKEGSYLLQNLNTHVFRNPEAVMHNIVRCARFLKGVGDRYPMEILNPYKVANDDTFLYREGDDAWRLFNFIENTTSLNFIRTEDQAREIGKAFGVFLANINRDDPDHYKVTIPDFHNFTKRYQDFVRFLDNDDRKYEDHTRQLIEDIHQYAPPYIRLEEKEFPVRIAHHDTKANNILLDQETGLPRAVIDLDTLMPGDIFSDYGDLIRTVLNPYEEDQFPESETRVDAGIYNVLHTSFLDPLRQILTEDEVKYLNTGGKKIILLQVIRFLEDHLRGDVYYQVRYAGHNLDRARSQMNLFKAIDQTDVQV